MSARDDEQQHADDTSSAERKMARLDEWLRAGRRGYTDEQIRSAFDLVTAGMDNWKMPIDVIVPADADLKLIDTAIIWHCGCGAEVETLPDGRYRVTAAGYYESVGS